MITADYPLHAHGKLLLTAEYFVLDGALALALPVRLGQSLDFGFRISDFGLEGQKAMHWRSLDEKGGCWFEAKFSPENFDFSEATDPAIAERLQKILQEARKLNPAFLHGPDCGLWTADCQLDFPRLWGLGTSSTLIYLVAKWAKIDPFELSARTFGGSGYDIACAGADGPILYRLENGKPHFERCDFRPPFHNSLYFIYLGKKQDSREGIKNYRQTVDGGRWTVLPELVAKITVLTGRFLAAQTLAEFEELIREHEVLVAETIGLPSAKSLFFNDFWGEIKSLGAWGGDFVLATSDRPMEETRRYFNEKGFEVFLPYDELVL
ncbi:MAG: GYDIA family GHMP kinase [Saprospiraceae bacterium]|nr:GYDIA family GHMP kinase [Saprospiraceae bacterium]